MNGKPTKNTSLDGKRALVTGAGRRVGRAIALALGAEGMHVAIAYRSSREGAEATAEEIRALGGQASLFQADLMIQGEARRLGTSAAEALGGMDLVVLSAANFERVEFDAIDDGHWDRALQLNLRAGFELVHSVRKQLAQAQGAVVFITGFCTQAPYRDYLPYVVSKGAVSHLMRVLSLEMAPDVRVNAVAPGTVLPPEDYDSSEIESLISAVPLARVGSAEAVAQAVLHLATASYTTGQELVVDGGKSVA